MADQRHDGSRKRTVALAATAIAAMIPSLLLPLAPAAAQMLCSKPLQPLCSTDLQNVTDATERDRCVSDTDKYLDELRSYRDCLQTALEKADESLKRGEGFKSCLDSGRKDCSLKNDGDL
ncbi:hypothetical protein SAMN06265365_101543 [Tistlia consotensis]|uniref:Uncharacterized protein n=2 Tax=Tistlia TaxID=1321364 RepID=A0A1Y6B585_9PROT|nr:hypothetical protein [Tistlia consotensis]SME92905.1 hypothetical protein SAMN05428998_101542 [Tistlia consotensis USBA 355]SNR28330.1 hypothetical protein SAMN06265365_101543 [Tistlia consotensis]